MIINSSNQLYSSRKVRLETNFGADFSCDASPRVAESVPLAIAADFTLTAAPRVRSPHVRQLLAFNPVFAFDAAARSRSQTGAEFLTEFGLDISPRVKLSLAIPDPIVNEFGENAFTRQYYTARLLGDGFEIPIQSASVESPKGTIGKRVSCTISKKQLSLITPAKVYKFQIGTRASWNGAITWHTVLENAALDARTYSLAWGTNQPADSLTFGAVEPLADRLGRWPTKNLIFYDSMKTSVDLTNQIDIHVDGDGIIETTLIDKPGLNFYYILGQLKTRLGFLGIETNIPNFEMTRVDFSYSGSYGDVLRGISGLFEPLIYTVGSVLWILDKTAALPEDFAPRALGIGKFSNWSQTIESGASVEGFRLTYVDSNSQADTYVDRIVTTVDEGTFGNPDYTRTEIHRTFRDWKNSNDLDVILRTDLISEIHSTYDAGLNLTGRETNLHNYDAQGKRTNSDRTVEALVPNLAASPPAWELQTVRLENQAVFYSNSATQKGRVFQSKTETLVSGLIAIDSDNTYFDKDGNSAPFKQSFEKAHEVGDLTESMTQEFGLLEKVTETLTPLGNNQFEVRVSSFDYLQGKPKNTVTEPKTGDASLSAVGGRGSELVILREGLTQAARTGLPLPVFAIGEVPLAIGKPLCKRMLKRKTERKQSGRCSLSGWDAALETGVFFTATGRNAETLGIFITEGYRTQFDNLGTKEQRVTTELDVTEI